MTTFAAAALALLAVPPQAGQPASPSSNGTIIVEGQRERAEIDKFVEQLAPPVSDTQLAKFLAPVCPGVVGLPDGQNQLVTDRIREVATTIGAPVAGTACSPNVIVMVVPNKRAAIENLRKKRPELFGDVPADAIYRLVNLPGPAAGWQAIGVTGEDGMPLRWRRLSPSDTSGTLVKTVTTTAMIGRLQQATVPQFLASILVVEDRALDGVTTTQFADYAAMRTLAPISWRDGELPSHSILNLLKPGLKPADAPLSVTWWDVAMLKSLYASSNSVPADIQRSAIASLMQREIRRVPADQR